MADVHGKAGGIDDPVWRNDAPAPVASPAAPGGRRRILAWAAILGVMVLLWVGVSSVISATLLRPFQVPSSSMVPTIQPGERVSVLLVASPGRQDIVIFHAPSQANTVPGLDLIKRVVAVGGDTVSCCTDGHVVVDGTAIHEPYADPSQSSFQPVHLPPGTMFVLGDNRLDSEDSRSWGPVPANLAVGTVVAQGAAALVLSPLVVGGLGALLLTFGVWFFGIRRTDMWRGAPASSANS